MRVRMNRLLPRILQALTLLPALGAVVVLNVDWTQQGHSHLGAFGVVHHQHSHTGDHRHSYPHGHSEARPHTHFGAGDSERRGASLPTAAEESRGDEDPGSPERSDGSDSFLASTLVLAQNVFCPIAVGLALGKSPWAEPQVEDPPTGELRHDLATPRGPPAVRLAPA